MLNTNNFNYNINAVSGTLRKSHPKSKFCVREVSNNNWVFDDEKPRLTHTAPEIVILQVMLTGENRCLIEYVNKADFESEEEIEICKFNGLPVLR